MARRKNTFTRFIEDIVDDTKDFVDDLLDRAKDIEEDAKDAVRNVVDDDEDTPKSKKDKKYDGELADLHAAIAELTATVNALAEAQIKKPATKAA